MLLEFSVENYCSIRDAQTLNMLCGSPSRSKTDKFGVKNYRIDTGIKSIPKIVSSAVIYGANASGKSTLLNAFNFLRWFIVDNPGRGLYNQINRSFLLDQQNNNHPHSFSIQVLIGTTRYHYQLSISKDRIEHEFLDSYQAPYYRKRCLFEREYIKEESDYKWKINKKIKRSHRIKLEKDSSTVIGAPFSSLLFLANYLEIKEFEPLFSWFKKKMLIKTENGYINNKLPHLVMNKTRVAKVLHCLNRMDTGISDIIVEKDSTSIRQHVQFVKLMKDGVTQVVFNQFQESKGTLKLFHLLNIILDALENGSILLIDDFDANLHPYVVTELIKMFYNPKLNTKGAQLVIVANNTALLKNDTFQRDQVWFTEKGTNGVTVLYSLQSFKPRRKEISIEDVYYLGCVGGIPIIPWDFSTDDLT